MDRAAAHTRLLSAESSEADFTAPESILRDPEHEYEPEPEHGEEARMTAARPFCAVRYDTEKVTLSNVIVPPYDVIAADERETYFSRDPHNAIRFELTRRASDEANADYSEVGETLAEWRSSGILICDADPQYYVMRQRFVGPSGDHLERVGFFAELGLEDYASRVVRPHERTLAGPKADRLKVLRASRANLSAVFLLYEDRDVRLLAAEAVQRVGQHDID